MKINYSIIPCSLGFVLIGATEHGLCALLLAETGEEALDALRDAFPKAELFEESGGLSLWGEQVRLAVEDPAKGWNLKGVPLDLQGTPFQKRVWALLQEIPPGVTKSYGYLAERLGMPTGARAVASACAANRVAIAVPCHRVVHRDGTISGYRWGVERKRVLLQREKVAQDDSLEG